MKMQQIIFASVLPMLLLNSWISASDEGERKQQHAAAISTAQQQKQAQFLKAAKEGDQEAIAQCLEEGVDVNCTNDEGFTGLMLAALESLRQDHLEIVQSLLKNNANPNLKGLEDSTALHYAGQSDGFYNGDIARTLLKSKADPKLSDKHKQTPLVYAAERSNQRVVSALVPHAGKKELEDALTACEDNARRTLKPGLEANLTYNSTVQLLKRYLRPFNNKNQ